MYAIFYNTDDLEAMARQLVRTDLGDDLKALAQAAWDNGFQSWPSAPGCAYERTQGDAQTRQLVVNGPPLDDLVTLLRGIADSFPGDDAANYMAAIADDISAAPYRNNSGAVEPWS